MLNCILSSSTFKKYSIQYNIQINNIDKKILKIDQTMSMITQNFVYTSILFNIIPF